MIGPRLTTPETNRTIVAESKVRWLGSVDRWDYAEHRGQEYIVYRDPTPDPGAYAMQAGEILIGRRVTEVIDGTRFEHNLNFRALPVSSGSYASAAAKEAEREAKRTRKARSRPLDALAGHPLLARRAEAILPIADPSTGDRFEAALSAAPTSSSVDLKALTPLVGMRSKAPAALRIAGREPRQGVAAILEVLQSKSVELALTPSGSMYALGVRPLDTVADLIDRAGPLLHAHLLGQPLRCEMSHKDDQAPEAVTLAIGGAALCEGHASGELTP